MKWFRTIGILPPTELRKKMVLWCMPVGGPAVFPSDRELIGLSTSRIGILAPHPTSWRALPILTVGDAMRRAVLLSVFLTLTAVAALPVAAEEDVVAFAVVSEVPKDKSRVLAKVAIDGVVSDQKLLASDTVLSNLIWRKLELCHAMKMEGQRVAEGFRITSVRVIDGAMLPMALQGYAGDCLLKKALEVAPFVD